LLPPEPATDAGFRLPPHEEHAMPPWKGSINELLSAEQIQKIEEALAGAPAGICVDKRGMRLNRYPGMLSNLNGEEEPFKVIASERPVTETGLVLISTMPIPEIERAMLVIKTDENFQQQIEGHALPSRTGKRVADQDQKTTFFYSIFQPAAALGP
jgi:hypothetical protein